MKKTAKSITYSKVGDNYSSKDPVLRLTLSMAASTSANLKEYGFAEIPQTRGESAFVWDQGDVLMATVTECLGTKNLIADQMRKITGKTYYDVIARDTVATFINDLSTSGAKPLVVNAYWAIGDNRWMTDKKRLTDFLTGWRDACNLAGAVWGGGETPTLKGIISSKSVDLAGSAVGIITPKKRLVSEAKLKKGDRIILLKSNGINANGISLARAVAAKLKKGYASPLSGGKTFGEALLRPSNIYARLIQDILDSGTDIHYIINITGHGLRKLMRARSEFSYVIDSLAEPQEIFGVIQKSAGLSDYEMYQTFNMGTDYALFIGKSDIPKITKIIKKNGFGYLEAGFVDSGPRRVIINPKNITYRSESYSIKV